MGTGSFQVTLSWGGERTAATIPATIASVEDEVNRAARPARKSAARVPHHPQPQRTRRAAPKPRTRIAFSDRGRGARAAPASPPPRVAHALDPREITMLVFALPAGYAEPGATPHGAATASSTGSQRSPGGAA